MKTSAPRSCKVIQTSLRVAQEGNAAGARRERLGAEIQMVRDAIRQNLEKLAKLEKANEQSGVRMASLEKLAEEQIAQKTKELNTAFVAVASKDVLNNKGVVGKQGSILGLGGRWIETGKFDPEVFREVDVTKEVELEIPAPASKVRVVTEQPKESYEIVDGGPNSSTSKLAVKDPSAFWKGDRYLVVMIPD